MGGLELQLPFVTIVGAGTNAFSSFAPQKGHMPIGSPTSSPSSSIGSPHSGGGQRTNRRQSGVPAHVTHNVTWIHPVLLPEGIPRCRSYLIRGIPRSELGDGDAENSPSGESTDPSRG